ncbi:MAG: hypothetical protein HQ483_14585 [Rhodospirillales bacterium]|nr:hypothetical protein [Rhodospirillales bacterium]
MTKLFRVLSLCLLAPVAGLAATSSVAAAAPQALGLVATYGDIELKCGAAGCSADFTTFCLQQDRASPDRGTPYQVGSGEIQVAGITAAGDRVLLDPRHSLALESRRKHMALRMVVPEATMREHGLVRVSINVKENVVLLPTPLAGENRPHTAGEVAMLSQSMRRIGSSHVDGNQDRIVAARVLGDVINGLPERGKADNPTRQNLWDAALRRAGPDAPRQGINRARGIFQLCKWTAGRGTPNMRDCLENHHDEFIKFLNSDYWKASKPIY